MEDYPMNLMEFERQFSSEEACLQYLSTLRFNRRKSYSRGKLFFRLVQQGVSNAPVSGDDIRGGKPL